jgi:hypothetical protein
MHLKRKKDQRLCEMLVLLRLVQVIGQRKSELITFRKIELQTIELGRVFLEFLK